MLQIEQIVSHYPPALQPFRGFILREYLQYKILEIIARLPNAQQLSFLGGTALRLLYDNQRFSEDIDFDNFGLSPTDFADLAEAVRQGLTAEGMAVEVSVTGQEAMRCEVRFPGLLFASGLSAHQDQKILLQIDTLAQGVAYEPEQVILNKFDVFASIRATPKSMLLAQKLYTCVHRRRPKGRDFFDIVFLLALGVVPDYHFLEQKVGITTEDELRTYILEQTQTFDFSALVDDVARFLFRQQDADKIRNFREIITSARLS